MALTLLTSNNASTVLASGISATATTLTVNTGTGIIFPSPSPGSSYFKLTLVDAATGTLTEIVHVTSRSGDVMTIVRAQEGTPARLWSANDIAANMLTAGTIAQLAQKDLSLQTANNLSEIATAGPAAVAAAVANLGLTEAAAAAADALKKSANLSDLASKPASRTNLGLGNSSTRDVALVSDYPIGTADKVVTLPGLVSYALAQSKNLSDVTNAATARNNLGLGNSSTLDVGSAANTVAAGNDTRITGALQKTQNLNDLSDKPQSRVNLGLGNSSTRDVATSAEIPVGTADKVLTLPGLMILFGKINFTGNSFIRIPDRPGGLIIQWGKATGLATGTSFSTVTFPTAFPNYTGSVITTRNYSAAATGAQANQTVRNVTSTTFEVNAADTVVVDLFWVAFGY